MKISLEWQLAESSKLQDHRQQSCVIRNVTVKSVAIRVFRKNFLCQNQSHRVAKDDKNCLKEHVKILTLYPNGK